MYHPPGDAVHHDVAATARAWGHTTSGNNSYPTNHYTSYRRVILNALILNRRGYNGSNGAFQRPKKDKTKTESTTAPRTSRYTLVSESANKSLGASRCRCRCCCYNTCIYFSEAERPQERIYTSGAWASVGMTRCENQVKPVRVHVFSKKKKNYVWYTTHSHATSQNLIHMPVSLSLSPCHGNGDVHTRLTSNPLRSTFFVTSIL